MTLSAGSDEWNRRYAAHELLWKARPSRFLVAETADLTPGRALDLACERPVETTDGERTALDLLVRGLAGD